MLSTVVYIVIKIAVIMLHFHSVRDVQVIVEEKFGNFY
jgi:hypothetical protein